MLIKLNNKWFASVNIEFMSTDNISAFKYIFRWSSASCTSKELLHQEEKEVTQTLATGLNCGNVLQMMTVKQITCYNGDKLMAVTFYYGMSLCLRGNLSQSEMQYRGTEDSWGPAEIMSPSSLQWEVRERKLMDYFWSSLCFRTKRLNVTWILPTVKDEWPWTPRPLGPWLGYC